MTTQGSAVFERFSTAREMQLQQENQASDKKRKKYAQYIYIFGLVEIHLGPVAVLLGGLVLIWGYQDIFSLTSQGIWCGAFLLAVGILAIYNGHNPSLSVYKVNFILSIVVTFFMVVMMFLSGIACASSSGIAVPVHLLVVLIGLAGMTLTIIQSVFCYIVLFHRVEHSEMFSTSASAFNEELFHHPPAFSEQFLS